MNFDKAKNDEEFDNKSERRENVESGNDVKGAGDEKSVHALVGVRRRDSDMLASMHEESAKALSDVAFYYGGEKSVESDDQEQIIAAAIDEDSVHDDDSIVGIADQNDVNVENDEKNDEIKENVLSEYEDQPAGRQKVRFVD